MLYEILDLQLNQSELAHPAVTVIVPSRSSSKLKKATPEEVKATTTATVDTSAKPTALADTPAKPTTTQETKIPSIHAGPPAPIISKPAITIPAK